ncbi:alpha/beta hydrolase [Solitalea koreensis]|uniref:Acetyl esterase/lipase n=1 Tax=Solitalea koreensis TaxID=543615 RepID=A0A521BYG6_9SPHI|nr:alpha/beta hydrolase [Solitalea koreensis]SMO52227.1 Acetyl esterase/lipase [Solitalea koreensis]
MKVISKVRILLVLMFGSNYGHAQLAQRNLFKPFTTEYIREALVSPGEWHPFPTTDKEWRKVLPDSIIKQYIANGDISLKQKNSAQRLKETLLYENEVPNSISAPNKEIAFTNNTFQIKKVSVPSITVYKAAQPNGKAIIICPGGGYGNLMFEKEGTTVAEELNRWGITAFVLKYRLPDDSTNIDKSLAPLQDAQQAIRWVRSNAQQWGVRKNRIGIMGFSAGGHLASTAATHFQRNADSTNKDTTSVRPDFVILVYPVISFDSTITHMASRNRLVGTRATAERINYFSNELQVSEKTPPLFLVHAGDDTVVPVENSIRFYQACIKNKVPAEMHLYPRGGHGFALKDKTSGNDWLERLKNWINYL